MYFDSCKSLLYSDTLIPDIFITEYMPSLNSDSIKIYVYCAFLSKYGKTAAAEMLSKKLDIDQEKVNTLLNSLEALGLIIRKNNNIILTDLKEKEINKIYRMKVTSTPEEAAFSSERNKKRNKILKSINSKFFQGLMSPSWYVDIDGWFDKYNFDEDVMYSLFQHCYDHNGLSKNYIVKVAEHWHNKGIKNIFDLDNYYLQYQKIKDIKLKIVQKLKLKRFLTEYEEAYLEQWVVDYGFDFDIIEIVLKRTTGKTNPSFNYIHAVLTDWHKKGLKTKEDVLGHLKNESTRKSSKSNINSYVIPQHVNFEQRAYTAEELESFFVNIPKKTINEAK